MQSRIVTIAMILTTPGNPTKLVTEHLGKQISVAGFSGVGMSGTRRHPDDTDELLILTLYDQEGILQGLPVRRSRDMEMFQEWLRRFDRYTPQAET
jgi:hypothetical protein